MGPALIASGADLGARVESSAPSSSVGASLGDWERAAPRVELYLRALGVGDQRDHARLMDTIRSRFAQRVASQVVADATETGIEVAAGLLDEWVASQLGPGVSEQQLRAGRAAVLSGAVEGWAAVWSGRVDEPLGERIRAASLSPAPEMAPLSMAPQPIRPCCDRLTQWILKLLSGKQGDRPHQTADSGRAP